MPTTTGKMNYNRSNWPISRIKKKLQYIKICGIPETVKMIDLHSHFQNILQEVLPDIPMAELSIDSIHRQPKWIYLPKYLPRDTIASIHFFSN